MCTRLQRLTDKHFYKKKLNQIKDYWKEQEKKPRENLLEVAHLVIVSFLSLFLFNKIIL